LQGLSCSGYVSDIAELRTKMASHERLLQHCPAGIAKIAGG